MHPEDDPQIAFYSLATRCLTGEATGDEQRRLAGLLDDPQWKKMFETMRSGWEGNPANALKGYDVKGALEKIRSATTESAATKRTEKKKRAGWWQSAAWRIRFPVTTGGIALAAASLAVVILAVFVVSRPKRPAEMAIAPIRWIEQVNGAGERLMLTLGDGTKITLNAGSTLSYPDAFGPRNRVVRLKGEGFFDVARDERRPFVVETSTLRVTVLGTQFNVRAFDDGSQAQVTLVHGKVQVTPAGSRGATATTPVTLTDGMRYSVAAETGKGEVRTVPAGEAVGWIQDKLVWENEPLPSAMKELERRFGIVVEITDQKLREQTITARFGRESLEEIFDLIHLTAPIRYEFVRSEDGKIKRVVLSLNRQNETTP
ncbi:anti-FecI sigma factor FecR [Opitutaceae bacterium TAV5]|nr:anti-FecI sigma factor FecR [Opitutaceae bacterium TAV5]